MPMHKCHFGATEIDFLGRTITSQDVKPQKNVQNFLEKNQVSKIEKGFTTLFGILETLPKLCPKTI